MMQRSVTMTASRGNPVILPNNAGKMVASSNAVLGIFLWLYGVKKVILNDPKKKEKSNGN